MKYGLNLNPRWKQQVEMYFRSLAASNELHRGWKASSVTSEHICNTYERNIVVDRYGVARLCFSDSFPGAKLLNYGDLRLFWERADFVRERMRHCNKYCGISHSVRRESSRLRPDDPALAYT